jgi:barstar (barnase inhibitor)
VSKELRWTDLVEGTEPRILGVTCSEAELDSFVWRAPRRDDMVVRVLRGSRSSSRKELFQEWGAALQFPYYFGHNWAALDECLDDLEWLPARRYVLFLTEFQDVLATAEEDLRSYIRVLQRAAFPATPNARTMTFVLQSPSHHADVLTARLQQVGLEDWSWKPLELIPGEEAGYATG